MAEIVRPRETKIDVGDRACRGEKETLRVLFGDLVESIDTAILLPAALSSSLISEQQRSDCASEADPYKKAEKLLTYLQRSVNGDSNKFHTFVKILRETNQETIAVRLQDNLDMVTRQIASNPEDNPVFVPDELVEELARLRVDFAMFLLEYEEELQKSIEAQSKFIKILKTLLGKKLSDCSFQSYFNTLKEEEVSLFNITYLDELCKVFPNDICAKTKKLVDEYKQKYQRFMASTTVNQFKKLFPASVAPSSLLNGKVPITLKLKSYWGDKTVDELAKFVDVLDVPGRHLHLYRIRKGCTAVVWLCSITDVKEQKEALWEANISLQDMGVLQLFIGEVANGGQDGYMLRQDETTFGEGGLHGPSPMPNIKLPKLKKSENVPKVKQVYVSEIKSSSNLKNYAGDAAVGGVSGGLVSRTAAGAGVGALVGGIVGSVVPGPGTALGALIGAGVGGGIGTGWFWPRMNLNSMPGEPNRKAQEK